MLDKYPLLRDIFSVQRFAELSDIIINIPIDPIIDHHREERPSRDVDPHVVVPEVHDRKYESERNELPDTSRLRGRADTRDQVPRHASRPPQQSRLSDALVLQMKIVAPREVRQCALTHICTVA